MDNQEGGMEKLLTIEKTITGMIELHSLVVELKEMEIRQKKTIEDLQRDINQHKTFLENIPLKFFVKNVNLSYIYCSPSYANDLKKNPEEIIGKTDWDFFPADLAEKFEVDDKKVLETGELENFEDRYIVNNQQFIVHMVKNPLRDKNNTIIGLMGIFWDITKEKQREEEATRYQAHLEGLLFDRKEELEETGRRLQKETSKLGQVEERLRQKEEIHRVVFEGIGIALAVLGTEEMILLQTNKKLEEILSIPPEEREKKKTLLEFIAGSSLEGIKEQYLAIKTGANCIPKGREYQLIDQHGNWKDIFVTMALIPGTENVVASFLDVSERNHMEKALRRFDESHRWLIEKAPMAIAVIQDGVFKFVNPRIIELFGYSREELTSRPVLEFIYSDDQNVDLFLFKKSDEGEPPNVFSLKIYQKDGTIRWVEDRNDLIQWEGSPATINFFVDITFRKQAENELLNSIQPFKTLIEKVQRIITKA